jgi:hypothetical protein
MGIGTRAPFSQYIYKPLTFLSPPDQTDILMVPILGVTDDSDATYRAPGVSPDNPALAYTPVNGTTESSPRNCWPKTLPELPSTSCGELDQTIYDAPRPLGPVLSHYKTDLEVSHAVLGVRKAFNY